MWMTVAQKFDDFVCLNFIDIPEGFKVPEGFESAESFIRARILGKDNRDLAKVTLEAEKILRHFVYKSG